MLSERLAARWPKGFTVSALLEFRHVSRVFSVKNGLLSRPSRLLAVDDVSLSVEEGETLGLVGESGCGKSTLARMAVRLLPASSGEILLEGKRLADWSSTELAGRIQMVFQDPFSSLNPRLTVGASVAEPLLLARRAAKQPLGKADLKAEVAAMLQKVGLDPAYASRYPHEFSGGQRQRVAVARALIAGPRLLVCDEPVSALDASVQAQTLNLLKDMKEARGLSYLFISHDLGVVGFMSERIAVMYLGKVVELAPRELLFTRPCHPYTEALLASAPVRDPAQREDHGALPGELPSPLSPPPGCPFHPRCPYVQELCRAEVPAWLECRPGQYARCHFPRNM